MGVETRTSGVFEWGLKNHSFYLHIEIGGKNEDPRVLAKTDDVSIVLDPVTREIRKNNETLLSLTKNPTKLLLFLIDHPNEYFSTDKLALHMWSDVYRRASGVHNLISKVRNALEATNEPQLADRIQSKRYKGYVWLTETHSSYKDSVRK